MGIFGWVFRFFTLLPSFQAPGTYIFRMYGRNWDLKNWGEGPGTWDRMGPSMLRYLGPGTGHVMEPGTWENMGPQISWNLGPGKYGTR